MPPETSDEILKALERELEEFEVAYENGRARIPIINTETGVEWNNAVDGDPTECFIPGTHGYHELLDRTYLVNELVDNMLMNHPSLLFNKDAARWLDLAAYCLTEAYVTIGRKLS